MQAIIDFFRPPDDNPAAKSRWRTNVSIALMVTAAIGLMCAFGPFKVAFADDVDLKISTATAKLEQKIQAVADEQKQQNAATNKKLDSIAILQARSLAQNVATQIRLTISKRCKTTGFVEREELNREKERLQDEYRAYIGERYIEPRCDEL